MREVRLAMLSPRRVLLVTLASLPPISGVTTLAAEAGVYRGLVIVLVRRIVAVVAAAGVLGVGVVGCSTAQAVPDPVAERGAEIARVDAGYLEQVRMYVPGLAGVDDTRLVQAALFTCAAHGDLTDMSKTATDLAVAATDLMIYGYVPHQPGAYDDARVLAGLTGVTCI